MLLSLLTVKPVLPMDTSSSFEQIPGDIQLNIFMICDSKDRMLLEQKDILTLFQVSTNMKKLASDGLLWSQLSKQDGFTCHPQTAFKSHYHYLKAQSLYKLNPQFSNSEMLQIMIECLNKSAPLMHYGAVEFLMTLMSSSDVPLEIQCIYLPEALNLNVFPFLKEEELLALSDEDFLWAIHESLDGPLENFLPVRHRYYRILDKMGFGKYASIFQKLHEAMEKNIDFESIKNNEHFGYLNEIDEEIVSLLEIAKNKRDFFTIDMVICYLESVYGKNADSSESTESDEEQDDSLSVTNGRIKSILKDIDVFIRRNALPHQISKMQNYLEFVCDENNEEAKEENLDLVLTIMQMGSVAPFHIRTFSYICADMRGEEFGLDVQNKIKNISCYFKFLEGLMLTTYPALGFRESPFGKHIQFIGGNSLATSTQLGLRILLSECSLANTFYDDQCHMSMIESILDKNEKSMFFYDQNADATIKDPHFCKKYFDVDSFQLFQKKLALEAQNNLMRFLNRNLTKPKNCLAEIYEYLSHCLVKSDPKKALEYAQQSYEIDPEGTNTNSLRTLIKTLIHCDQFDKAQDMINKMEDDCEYIGMEKTFLLNDLRIAKELYMHR